MVGHFAVFLVLVPALVGVGETIGVATASTIDVVTRELSPGVREAILALPNKRVRVGKRDSVDLTRQNCASTCGGKAGSGPNQVDCNLIINALNANNTATFTMDPYSVAKWVHASCTIEFIQSTGDTVTYTYIYLGNIASHLSNTCNAANGYAEGRCIFDGREDAIWVGNTAASKEST